MFAVVVFGAGTGFQGGGKCPLVVGQSVVIYAADHVLFIYDLCDRTQSQTILRCRPLHQPLFHAV